MCERRNVPVPRALPRRPRSTIRASATTPGGVPLIQRPSAIASPRLHRPGEVQVEGGRQQEAVADQAVRGIEGRVVQHLEIERAVRGAGGVEASAASTLKRISRVPGSDDLDVGFEQAG